MTSTGFRSGNSRFSARLKPGGEPVLKTFKPPNWRVRPEESLWNSPSCGVRGGRPNDEKSFFFEVFKRLRIPHADVGAAVEPAEGGGFKVRLSADRPPFFVMLGHAGNWGRSCSRQFATRCRGG
jgi:hypothetical protein